ncbi:FAD-binding oxidoreductase [Ancylobacter sonchi]|uniref:NAD(P)/FAD-dependent oxidoreductase n=1 Tax=Ancylobacter sonchi TaxID=1937790 RepID=UPI001BD246A6|nr:FAD-binding oxidoreductase [Ancylobacter sonchi]MBS7534720.1 FAD-binding oxidoreductase [Ancylobacter sonchi]
MANAPENDVVVVGAGIIGLSAALLLQRAGRTVTVVDPLPPGSATSYGNAGLLSAGTNMPIALPGIWRNVPGWLTNPDGTLAVRWRYLPTAAPWLAKWILASPKKTVYAASDALRALHRDTMDGYRELLGPSLFAELIRTEGSVNVFYNATPGRNEPFIRHLIARHGIVAEDLDHAALKEMFPGIGPVAQRALYFPHNGWTVNPGRLTRTVGRLFAEAGGVLRHENVMSVRPVEGGFELFGTLGDFRARTVVLATGSWTGRLLAPLGVNLPMETERGYHLMLEGANITPKLPLLLRDGGMAITPMEEGLRLAGTVEIAGLDAPPDERRARQLMDRAKLVFPGLEAASYRKWLGFRPSLPDSVAAIGPVPGMAGLFVAAGHGHTGMVGASTTARLVRDLVTGTPPHIDPAPYSLARFNRM